MQANRLGQTEEFTSAPAGAILGEQQRLAVAVIAFGEAVAVIRKRFSGVLRAVPDGNVKEAPGIRAIGSPLGDALRIYADDIERHTAALYSLMDQCDL